MVKGGNHALEKSLEENVVEGNNLLGKYLGLFSTPSARKKRIITTVEDDLKVAVQEEILSLKRTGVWRGTGVCLKEIE